MDKKYWDKIYQQKNNQQMSWFQLGNNIYSLGGSLNPEEIVESREKLNSREELFVLNSLYLLISHCYM